MKILTVVDFYEPSIGGVEVITKLLSKYFVKKNHEVRIITSRMKNTPPYEEKDGVKIYRVGVPIAYGRYLFMLFAFLKVLDIGRDVDIIQTNTYTSAFPAWLASKILRKPCVISYYEAYGKRWFSVLPTRKHIALLLVVLERILAHLNYDIIVNISDYTKKHLMSWGVPEKRIRVIHTALDYSFLKSKKSNRTKIREKLNIADNFVFGYFGRPAFTKGLDYLIKAMPEILRSVNKAKFLFILSRSPAVKYAELMSLIRNLNLEKNVFVLDPVPRNKLPDYISAMDCVVVPSIGEDFSITAAEASYMGRPIVISKTASLAASGKYLLVEPASSKSIADACIKIYRKKYKRSKLRYFTLEKTAEGYLKVFKDVLNKKSY